MGDGGDSALVDNAEDVVTSVDAVVLGSLAPYFGVVGWNGDDGVDDLLAKVGIG